MHRLCADILGGRARPKVADERLAWHRKEWYQRVKCAGVGAPVIEDAKQSRHPQSTSLGFAEKALDRRQVVMRDNLGEIEICRDAGLEKMADLTGHILNGDSPIRRAPAPGVAL